MSGYFIAFIVATVLYVISNLVVCYTKNCLGKKYEFLGGVKDFLDVLVMLTFAWWILERFFSGFDSSFWEWILALMAGIIFAGCIGSGIGLVCQKIWSADSDKSIS